MKLFEIATAVAISNRTMMVAGKNESSRSSLEKGRKGIVSIERLAHFQCGACKRWWSIGDIPAGQAGTSASRVRRAWFCPWCGLAQKMVRAQ